MNARLRVVAILESMWDWRGMTSGAGYSEAPRYFRINPANYSGRRLYRLVGPDARLLVTNACRELVRSPREHGTPDPAWLRENLELLEPLGMDVLLVCGRVAQLTFRASGFVPQSARVMEIMHPAAHWRREALALVAAEIAQVAVQSGVSSC